MEKQQFVLGNRESGTVSGAAPTFFVILKQQQGNGKADQGILVANRDACALASSVTNPVKSKVKTCLPADCVSGGITVTLDNNSMWNEFYHRNTEMILTKQGRRMFPYCRYWITGLDSNQKYILVMDISPVDNHRYKWNGRWWEPSGKAEPHVLGRVFIHPESPSTGQYWMHQPVSFYKLKLTNNTLDQEGHIILHSMHRYLPRLHLVPADKATEVIQLNGPDVHTFTFPQTEFFAVTAYQNIQITQLKIDYNPFAKGFRDDGLNSRPQRDIKQNNNSEQEGGSVSSSPSNRGRSMEADGLDSQQRDLESSFSGQNPSDMDLEKDSFNAERDFLGFLDADMPSGGVPKLKQEVSESPIASSYESSSRVASPVDPNGHFNVVVKEEPVDDYDYGSSACIEGVTVKQEDTDEETDEYSNSDDDPILEKQLRKHSELDGKEADARSRKRILTSPSGVAKAKMLKFDSGKMPVVYLEPCSVTKSTVKISELPETMLSCKKDKSSLSAILDSLPAYFENHKGSCLGMAMETEKVAVRKMSPGNKVLQKYYSVKERQWTISKSSNLNPRGSAGSSFSAKHVTGRKKTRVLKNSMSQKSTGTNQNSVSSGPSRRGRPRKLKISKAGRPPKNLGKTAVTSKNASLGPGNILPDVKPDLEDVDGVLFVSFASKEALDIHTVDRAGGEESQSVRTPMLTSSDPDCEARICQLEKELMEDLKSLRHKQVIHPSLQEVGLKLNSVDPTLSIDLKYLGVQLPLSYSNCSLWNYPGVNPSSPDGAFPFVSRTGKTNDFTKIKGWRGKFHGASRNEGSSSEGSLKNRSAFYSDKLDEYLENEGKLMETSLGFSASAPTSPVVYQLPTKSTSYVRTLDSVLKKQSNITPSTSYTFKPLSVSSTSRRTKTQNKQAASNSRSKPSYKPILPSPVVVKQKHGFSGSGERVTKSAASSSAANQGDNFMVPALDENMLPKQISLRQAQQQQAARLPGLSKSQVKLMDLEDCALWDGKPRTYITEERADISLATLLTAQASLKNKPIHKIIRRRAPPCNNDFCRLGCICASLALEKRQPTHCRRPDCMFGCICLKRKVLLVKGGSKHKRILKRAVRGSLVFYGTQGEDHQEEEEVEGERDGEDELKQKDRKKRKKVEYTICDTEPEQPVRNCPLWVKVEGEVDPEPIYIPTPSVIEPAKPMVLPNPEVLPCSRSRSSSTVKPGRVYTPKPNPVIREEDKDPVYLYFESMMTCARVRAYEHKVEEKKQQKNQNISNLKNCSVKESLGNDSEHQSPKRETCEMEKDTNKSEAARPSPGGVFTQFVMSKVGALQQKIPGVSTPQPLTGPQKFNIRPTPLMVVSPVVPSRPSPVYCTLSSGVTAATTTSPVTLESVTTVAPSTVATTTVTTTGPTGANESTYSPPGIAITGAPGTSGTTACTTASPSTPTDTVNVAKTTEMATPVATVSFPKSVVTSPTVTHPVPTTSTSTVVTTTAVVTSTVTTPTSSIGSVPIILSGINTGPSLNPRPEDAAPLTTTANPQGLPSGTEKRVGPRLLLIPVQGAPPLRPLHNVQLAQGQRMVLQPLRSPGGVNLFRHPNGQIIQLVPLHQLRAAGTQPNVQPVMVRNPGSVVGIRLPGPSKPPETPVSPTLSTPVSSVSPVTSPVVQTMGSMSPQAANLVTQASSILPPVPCFVSQASTLTLRISPPASSTMAGQTCSETKVTQSSGGQPTSAANLIPLQSGSFAVLQLPGQKSVPNSILHHVASLQVKKDSKNVSQKEEELIPTKQQEDEKTSQPEEVEVMESEVTVSDSKPEENELSVDQLTSTGESAASMMLSDRNSVASETADRDSEMLEDYSNDTSTFQHDVSADVISSDHSYISEKNKVVTEKKEIPVDSEEASREVSDNAETVLQVSDQTSLIADEPTNTTYPLSFRKQEEAAEAMELKSCGVEQMNSEQAESPDTNQEENAQSQNKGKDTVDAAQPQSPQEKQEHYAELESKEEQKTQPPDNQKEPEDNAAEPEVKKECEGSTEAESIREEQGNKSEISHTGEKNTTSGEKHVQSNEGCKSLVIQESHGTPNQGQGTADFQEEGRTGKVDSKRVSDSGNKISNHATTSKNKSSAESDDKTEKSAKDYLLTAEERAQELKHHKKGYIPTADTALDYLEEDDEDEDDEKTDDSADEMLDGASDFQSEEEVDVEKLVSFSSSERSPTAVRHDVYWLKKKEGRTNSCEYSEDEEQVDIETVEELSEKINIARLKATAANIRPSKQKYHMRSSSDEKTTEKSTKKPQFWNRKQKSEAEAFAHYRQTHTANERRRRNEMRDLFEKLKGALGLHNIPKVSKCYILKQAYEEIQGLTDQADKLIGQKNLLTRKQDALIRKVSTLSGKTEEVVLKKLEYIYAKQKAVEAQKKKQVEPKESSVTTMPNRQQEGSITSSRELGQMIVTNRRGKPLILARKGNQATEETTSPPLTLTTASLVMTPQGQVLTLKSPLMPGQMAAVPSTLLQAELKPQTASNTVTAQPGITSVMIQLPGSPVPVQVKGIFTNSTIPIALSAVAGNAVPPAVVTAVEPSSESEDLFMMPKIVNVTSLAGEGGMSLNLNRNKSSQITPGASAQTSEQPLKTGLRESKQSEGILSEEKAKASSGSSAGDGKSAKGPTPVFLENKDSSISQLRNASSAKDSQEPFTTKLCLGEFIGCQGRRKNADQGGERLKAKDSPFRKLQIKEFKDSRIEMELRKVASAIEEAELDPSEILGGIEESDDTDETLTSLLNEIAFLNQQLNDDNSSMSELPSTLTTDFSPGDLETRRGAASDLVAADGTSFQFGHLGGSFRPSDLSEVRGGSGSISPLLLHLEDDDITDGEKNSGEPSSEADILKIVIGSGMKDALPNLSVAGGRSGKTLKPMAEPPSVTPPVLQMKTNSEAGTDTLWRPMPKLAPLGLKAANLPLDSEGQGTKVMPLLAPVVAKLTPVGLKTALPTGVPEGQDNKAMPILAPVVAKVNSTGTLPPNTASK
ncbi:MAX gene-associated protein isoform X6 [Alligator mississippiensis]|uniref:MAX gene-associated protein isoform X6 n=1 Tax=Alligator mississippiensis TaxID=8496 RepID=UPI000907064D|nr:MAX gene-associated protein isoform X6 [Alligator mississippiensis]